MNQSHERFCRLYRPIGALLLLLAVLLLVLRSCGAQKPATVVSTPQATSTVLPAVAPTSAAPTAVPTMAPTLALPTAVPTTAPTLAAPTAIAIALPIMSLPQASDYAADGVKLSGTGQPGTTVEVWDGTTKVGTAVVGADGAWSLLGKLAEGVHKLVVRTVDAAGKILNELPAVDVTVPKAIALPTLNAPAAADRTEDGVKLSGTGEPGAMVEIWDGATKVGTAAVGADGIWSLFCKLSEGTYRLIVRTVDAAGNTLNKSAAVEVTVPSAQAPAVSDDLAASGETYIVQPCDWLIKLARRFYGDPSLYTWIFDGTNAKAELDSTFARIADPDMIFVGQKLWIPAKPVSH